MMVGLAGCGLMTNHKSISTPNSSKSNNNDYKAANDGSSASSSSSTSENKMASQSSSSSKATTIDKNSKLPLGARLVGMPVNKDQAIEAYYTILLNRGQKPDQILDHFQNGTDYDFDPIDESGKTVSPYNKSVKIVYAKGTYALADLAGAGYPGSVTFQITPDNKVRFFDKVPSHFQDHRWDYDDAWAQQQSYDFMNSVVTLPLQKPSDELMNIMKQRKSTLINQDNDNEN